MSPMSALDITCSFDNLQVSFIWLRWYFFFFSFFFLRILLGSHFYPIVALVGIFFCSLLCGVPLLLLSSCVWFRGDRTPHVCVVIVAMCDLQTADKTWLICLYICIVFKATPINAYWLMFYTCNLDALRMACFTPKRERGIEKEREGERVWVEKSTKHKLTHNWDKFNATECAFA